MKVNSENDGMSLDDILTILKSSLDASLPKGKRLSFNIQLEENLYTQNHYLLLSIFRNLFNNAIEAADGNLVELSVRQSSTDSSYVIEVEDHGPGIDPEDMEQIFEPGFSTKINYETGEVNRGLGLSLVKDFIEFRLGGTIRVTSVPGKTVFTLTIPKEKWMQALDWYIICTFTRWYNKKHQRRKHMSRVGFVRNSIYEKGLKKMARA